MSRPIDPTARPPRRADPVPPGDLARRKDEHLDAVLAGTVAAQTCTAGFEAIRFEHAALPELDIGAIDLSTSFLGKRMAAPLLVSSMTGGPSRAATINRAIAVAAEELQIAFAVGSQRVALTDTASSGLGRDLRAAAPKVPILANFGAAQLKTWDGPDMARRAVDMIGADALIIHLNPLQEAVQRGGDTNWTGLLKAIEDVARAVEFPIVVKEVGAGISSAMARRLVDAGVRVIDVAGLGGTSWAQVEAERATDPAERAVATCFRDWGIPTARCIADVRAACPDVTVIGSGGIKDGLDGAKALRLGADLFAQAAGVLPAALAGPEALVRHLRVVMDQLRIACFCTGSRDVAALRRASLVDPPSYLVR
jgi:isopentenyl-diphosphate delta-isomerase